MYMKILIDSDWLRAVQLNCNFTADNYLAKLNLINLAKFLHRYMHLCTNHLTTD